MGLPIDPGHVRLLVQAMVAACGATASAGAEPMRIARGGARMVFLGAVHYEKWRIHQEKWDNICSHQEAIKQSLSKEESS